MSRPLASPARTDEAWSRFHSKVEELDGCWVWAGHVTPNGYGSVKISGRRYTAHRVLYEWTVGAISRDLQLDHLCRNRRCVNPDHLEPVSPRENLLRGEGVAAMAAARTHCVNGHAFTEENTITRAKGHRGCRECGRIRSRAYLQRRAS